MQRIQDILCAPEPYGMIKDAESLIQTVGVINNTLVTEHRDDVLQHIDACIAKVATELDAAKASADLRNQCLHPLQSLKRQLETQASIAHIHQARQDATEAADEAIDKIESVSRLEDKSAVGDVNPPAYIKKRRVVRAAQLASKGFLETQTDVDDYLNRLRSALESVINSNERAEIR